MVSEIQMKRAKRDIHTYILTYILTVKFQNMDPEIQMKDDIL